MRCKATEQLKRQLHVCNFVVDEVAADPYLKWGMIQDPRTKWAIQPARDQVLEDRWGGLHVSGLLVDRGFVFTDGSLQKPIVGLKLATWARVQIAEDGDLLQATYGPVPLELPQTSGAGEHVAFDRAVLAAKGAMALFTDYNALVLASNSRDQVKQAWASSAAKGGVYVGCYRSLLARPADAHPVEVQKVKAHLQPEALEDELDVFL